MTREIVRRPLMAKSPGTERFLTVLRYGTPGARPKAYIQAALHADETPALIAAHHLRRLLDQAADEGRLRGEVVLVPYANPIGLGQFLDGRHLGRYEFGGGGNFNRNWPDLTPALIDALTGQLRDDPGSNVAAVRAAMLAELNAREAASEMDSLRLELARLAADADFVFDLHCDSEALMHLYLLPQHWPQAKPLACELGAPVVLTAEDSGGGAFDECFSTPWVRLARQFPDHPLPAACLATTIELRGRADVSDRLGAQDAEALLRSLQRYGVVAGDPGPLPALPAEPTPLTAVDTVRAPAGGVVAYGVALGQRVAAGDIVAWIVDPAADADDSGRRPVRSTTDGLVFTLRAQRYAQPGQVIAKIAGAEPLAHRRPGQLLDD